LEPAKLWLKDSRNIKFIKTSPSSSKSVQGVTATDHEIGAQYALLSNMNVVKEIQIYEKSKIPLKIKKNLPNWKCSYFINLTEYMIHWIWLQKKTKKTWPQRKKQYKKHDRKEKKNRIDNKHSDT